MKPVLKRKIMQKIAEPHDWRICLNNSENHLRILQDSTKRAGWSQAGLAALHTMTTLGEAILASRIGLRTASESPGEIAALLLKQCDHPETEKQILNYVESVGRCHQAKFEDRGLSEEEAKELERIAEEFLRWGRSLLPLSHL